MSDNNGENVCIDSNAFIFNSGYVRAKKQKRDKKNKKRFVNLVKPKCSIFKLCKSEFNSCSLGVSNDKEDAWNVLLDNLINIYQGHFIISLTNCDSFCKTINRTYAKLKKYKISDDREEIKLYFNHNLNPYYNSNVCVNGKCYQFGVDTFYNLEKKEYCNIQFWYDKNYIYKPLDNILYK